jgi:hypothetical protein
MPGQPMSAPPQPGQPWPTQPMSAPPQPGQPWPTQPMSGVPMSGVPMSSAPVTGWPAYPPPPPPPPKKNTGKVLGIVLGIAIPVIAVCAVLGVLVVPKVLSATPEATTTPTPDILAVPKVGTCYLGSNGLDQYKDDAETDSLVACTAEHEFETIASGKINDTEQPTATSTTAHDLFGQCETAAADFLGTSYRATLTLLVLSVPSSTAWADGANWYRCDLGEIASMWDTATLRSTGSLKGHAKAITCLSWDVSADGTGISNVDSSDCTVVHNGELAAVAPVPATVDRNDHDALLNALSDVCYPKVTAFLGETDLRDELDFWINHPGTDTDGLDQNVLCMVSASDLTKKFTASLKGVGSGAIPFA